MSISELFLLNICHVLENILDQLPVRDLAKCRQVARPWESFIDSSRKLSRRLVWMKPDLADICHDSCGPVEVTLTNVCVDEDVLVIDEDRDGNDDNEEGTVRSINVYDAKNFTHINHIGKFHPPTFHCLQRMKLIKKRLIIFTTSNYEDKLLTYDLSIPSHAKLINFRPEERIPLLCADADEKYDLSVYNFNPNMMNLNFLETGLLVRRIPVDSYLVLAVKIGWPMCVAITAYQEQKLCAKSDILCFNLDGGSLLYKVDMDKHLVMMAHLVCEGHSQIHILEDTLIISFITETGVSLRVWIHDSEKKQFTLDRPHHQADLGKIELLRFSHDLSGLRLNVPPNDCKDLAAEMVPTWEQLQSYQPRRIKQLAERLARRSGETSRNSSICQFRIRI